MLIRLFTLLLLITTIGKMVIHTQLDNLLNERNRAAISEQYYTFTKSDERIKWGNYHTENMYKRFPFIEKQIAIHMFGDSSVPNGIEVEIENISSKIIPLGKDNAPNSPALIFRTHINTPDYTYFVNLSTDIDTNILNIENKIPHYSRLKYSLTDLCIKIGIDLLNSLTIDEYYLDFESEHPDLLYVFKCDYVEEIQIKNRWRRSGIITESYTLIKMNTNTGEIKISKEKEVSKFSHMNVTF